MTDHVSMTRSELDEMLHRAAHDGALEALKAVGLGDESAASDIREVRDLMTAWRIAKRTVWKTVVQTLTVTTLTLMAAGVFFKIRH